VELGEDASRVESVNQDLVGPYHFTGSPVLHGFNKNCIAVNLGEDHDVLVAAAGFLGESPRLVGVNFLGCFILHVQYTIEDCAFFLGQACAVFHAKKHWRCHLVPALSLWWIIGCSVLSCHVLLGFRRSRDSGN
jgi:hypothetical protein